MKKNKFSGRFSRLKYSFFLFFLLGFVASIQSQDNPYVNKYCFESIASPLCDFNELDGNTYSLPDWEWDGGPINQCIESNDYFNISSMAFVGGIGTYQIEINMLNCSTGPGGAQGMEMAVYSYSGIVDECWDNLLVCNSTCDENLLIESNILVPGELYIMMFEGCEGSQCDYSIKINGNFVSYSEEEFDLTLLCDEETDCRLICPGHSITFSVEGSNPLLVNSIDEYLWSYTDQNGIIYDYHSHPDDFITEVPEWIKEFDEVGVFEVCLDKIITICGKEVDIDQCHVIEVIEFEDEDFGTIYLCENLISGYWGPQTVNDDPSQTHDPNNDGISGWIKNSIFHFGFNEAMITNEFGCTYYQYVYIEEKTYTPQDFGVPDTLCVGDTLIMDLADPEMYVWSTVFQDDKVKFLQDTLIALSPGYVHCVNNNYSDCEAFSITVLGSKTIKVRNSILCEGQYTRLIDIDSSEITILTPQIIELKGDTILALQEGIGLITSSNSNSGCTYDTLEIHVFKGSDQSHDFVLDSTICVGDSTVIFNHNSGIDYWYSNALGVVIYDSLIITQNPGKFTVYNEIVPCKSFEIEVVDGSQFSLGIDTLCIGDEHVLELSNSDSLVVLTSDILELSGDTIRAIGHGLGRIVNLTNSCGLDTVDLFVSDTARIEYMGDTILNVGDTALVWSNVQGVFVSSDTSGIQIDPEGNIIATLPGVYQIDFLPQANCGMVEPISIQVVDITSTFVFRGKVYNDHNMNGALDPSEFGLASFEIVDLSTNQIVYSNQEGEFELPIYWGPNEIEVRSTYGSWEENVVTITILGQDVLPNDLEEIPFVPRDQFQDGSLITSANILRCNTWSKMFFEVINTSSLDLNGVLEVTIDPKISEVYFDPLPFNQNGNLYQFYIKDLPSGQVFGPHIEVLVPAFNNADNKLEFYSRLVNANGDELDERTYLDTIRCSYDPNDKRVWPDRPGDKNEVLAGETLDYVIRFQNNGNDTAFYVEVVDVLSPYFGYRKPDY